MTDDEKANAAALWADIFIATPVDDVLAAVKRFVAMDTKGYPPTIGAIREIVAPKPALNAAPPHANDAMTPDEMRADQQRMLDYIELMKSRAARSAEQERRDIPAECVTCGKGCHERIARSL